MITRQLVRCLLVEYARNPVNLLMLVLVPAVFVVAAAGSLGDAAEVLGGSGAPAVATATAGWAAAFLTGLAMYFQMSSARNTDKRLVLAGLAPSRLVGARLLTGLTLALVTTAVSLLALAARTGVDAPLRVLAGTTMFALIYLALGTIVGSYVRDPVNGTVLILLVWIIDVFFGPAMGSVDRLATRWLPTHFATLWMVDLPSRHGGRPGDLGWALIWTVGALLLCWLIVVRNSRTARRPSANRPASAMARLAGGVKMGLHDYSRNPALWTLLIIVPIVFIVLATVITPDEPTTLPLVESGRTVLMTFPLPDIHPSTMTPIAVGSLATLAGLFIGLDAREGDQRLTLAGFPASLVLAARLTVMGAAVLLVTVVSLAVTATVFEPRQWGVYAGANLLLALTYGMIGVIIGPVFGRVAGVFVAFLLPFLDLGIGQSPMLRAEPPQWAQFLPGYGASRVMMDGGLTDTFDRAGAVALSVAWLAGVSLLAALLWRGSLVEDNPSRQLVRL